MKFSLIIEPDIDEEVIVRARKQSPLTDQIESLILQHDGADRITAYSENEIKVLFYIKIIPLLNLLPHCIIRQELDVGDGVEDGGREADEGSIAGIGDGEVVPAERKVGREPI